MKSSFCIRTLIASLIYLATAINVQSAPTFSNDEPEITFKLSQHPLGQVIEKVASQTGYTIEMERQYEGQLVSGNFQSVPVSEFFRRALKGKSSIIVISPEQKSIVVRSFIKGKDTGISTGQSQEIVHIIDTTTPEQQSPISNGPYADYLPEQLGGIHELDNNFTPKISGNDKHIIDPQTGQPWNEIDELMK